MGIIENNNAEIIANIEEIGKLKNKTYERRKK